MSFKPLGYILKWKIDFIEVLMKNWLCFWKLFHFCTTSEWAASPLWFQWLHWRLIWIKYDWLVVPHKFPDTHTVNDSAQLEDLWLRTYPQLQILQHARWLLLEGIVTGVRLECWLGRWAPLLRTTRQLSQLFQNGNKIHLKPEQIVKTLADQPV